MGADFLVSVADFLGEIILIYRCWLMWSRNYWIILLPSLIAGVTLGKSQNLWATNRRLQSTFGHSIS